MNCVYSCSKVSSFSCAPFSTNHYYLFLFFLKRYQVGKSLLCDGTCCRLEYFFYSYKKWWRDPGAKGEIRLWNVWPDDLRTVRGTFTNLMFPPRHSVTLPSNRRLSTFLTRMSSVCEEDLKISRKLDCFGGWLWKIAWMLMRLQRTGWCSAET